MNKAERRKQEGTAQKTKVVAEKMAKVRSDAIKYTSNRLFLVLACCLHDKWGWEETRISRLIAQVKDLFNSIDRNYVNFEDLAQDLEETACIKIIDEE